MTEQVTASQELQPFDIKAALGGYAKDISSLEEHFQTRDGQDSNNLFPKWWCDDAQRSCSERGLLDYLDGPLATADNVGAYYVLSKGLQELKQKWAGSGAPRILTLIPSHKMLAKGLSGDGENCARLRNDFLTEVADEERTGVFHFQALKDLFGVVSRGGLIAIGGDEDTFAGKVHDLLRSEKNLTMLRLSDRNESLEDEGSRTPSIREWSVDAVMSLGFNYKEAQRLTFTIGNTQEAGLLRTINAVDHFGVEGISKIADGLPHIWGIEGYSLAQLDRMLRLAEQPGLESERLKSHDTTLVLVNRSGDPGGVLVNTAAQIEADEKVGRIVFAEVRRLHHIRDTVQDFANVGIKPSTIVLAAHSNVLALGVGDRYPGRPPKSDHAVVATAALVNHVNSTTYAGTGVVGHALMEMDEIAHIVTNCMQPSRGIDDSAQDIGRKKIVLVGCGLGKEADIKGMDEQNEVVILGQGSFASELGRHLFEMGVRDVDIYAAPENTQIDKTSKGVVYTATPTGFDYDRPPQKAVLVRVTDEGVAVSLVDEVILRQ